MIHKAWTALANLSGINLLGKTGKATHVHAGLKRTTAARVVRFVRRLAAIDCLPHVAIALIVMHRRYGPINRYLVKIRSA